MGVLEIVAPERTTGQPEGPTVFLAGTIEQGTSEDWQAQAVARLGQLRRDIVVFNPRRRAWDASWRGHPEDAPFREQVSWELEHLARADLVLVHLEPGSKSPVSLLELGWLAAARPTRTLVSCGEGFWRWGNVAITAERFGLPCFTHLDALLDEACRRLDAAS